ncbi:MAG: hypothetical protein AAB507_00780 [Patescibacteria group bacterium]
MAKGISGWTTDDLLSFLESHNFYFHKELGGSHQAWISQDNLSVVEVNTTYGTYPERTLETMITNSNIDKKHWRLWTTLGSRDKKKATCCDKIKKENKNK